MIEVEIKLAIGSPEAFVDQLVALGAVLEHQRDLEDNVLLDSEQGLLRAKGAILRIRQYGSKGSLSFKEPATGPAGFKVRRELETPVADPARLIGILEAAGFRRTWRYMKYRTSFFYRELKIDVDETPVGNFAELEGPAEAIDAFASTLGKSPSDYILSNYWTLQQEWCRKHGTPSGDMLFDTGTT